MKVSLELFFVLPVLVLFVLLYLSWSSAANFSKPFSVSLHSVIFYTFIDCWGIGVCVGTLAYTVKRQRPSTSTLSAGSSDTGTQDS